MGKRTHEQRARALLVGVLLPGGSLATREWWELVGLCLHPPPSLSCVSYRAPGVTPSPRPGDALLLLLPRERSLLLCRARSVSPACPPLTDIPQSARPPCSVLAHRGFPSAPRSPCFRAPHVPLRLPGMSHLPASPAASGVPSHASPGTLHVTS